MMTVKLITGKSRNKIQHETINNKVKTVASLVHNLPITPWGPEMKATSLALAGKDFRAKPSSCFPAFAPI